MSEIELDVVLNDLKEIERIKNEALTYMAALSTINDECEENLFVDDIDTLKKFLQRVKDLSE